MEEEEVEVVQQQQQQQQHRVLAHPIPVKVSSSALALTSLLVPSSLTLVPTNMSMKRGRPVRPLVRSSAFRASIISWGYCCGCLKTLSGKL